MGVYQTRYRSACTLEDDSHAWQILDIAKSQIVYDYHTMKILAATLSLAAAAWGLAQHASRGEQLPFELQVVRGSATGKCDVITFRKTQIIRGLGSGAAHVTSLRTVSGDDKLSIISYDEEALWDQATFLCKHGEWMRGSVGRDMGGVPSVAGQEVFSEISLSHAYPPLEIFPLIKSGSSSNRVDLVFFSDGCKSHSYN